MEQQQRAILNANRGISNIVPSKTVHTDLRRVTDKLFDTLKNHYGPFSGFAALDNGQPLVETNFTKDGIGIINAVEFASPQEEWVRKTIAYIGSRMESSVGDGTTSAMMFTCAMLRHMSEHLHEIKPISYNQLKQGFKEFCDLVKLQLDKKYVIKPYKLSGGNYGQYTDEVDRDMVYKIVYHQAYTSTHGDMSLSHALADVFSKTPKELWTRMTYERRRQEDDTPFSIVPSEGQYSMNAKIFSTAMLNKELTSEFDCDKCTLFVFNDNIRVDSPDWDSIWFNVEKLQKDEAVVVVCYERMDDQVYAEINSRLMKNIREGRRLVILTQSPNPNANQNVNDFTAIQSLCSDDVMKFRDGNALIMKNVHVTYKHATNKLVLDNLYQTPDEYKDKLERFMVLDGKHSQLMETLEAWNTLAENYAKADGTRVNREMATYYSRLCVKLRYTTQYTLVIGGNAYDNVAMVDVVDDAIRAASRALVNGVTYGNNRALFRIASVLSRPHGTVANRLCLNPCVRWIAKMVTMSLEDISKVVLERLYPNKKFYWPGQKKKFVEWWKDHTVDLLLYDPSVSWEEQDKGNGNIKIGDNPAFKLWSLLNQDIIKSVHPITQPANSDTVMLERFGEIALKFILTECIVIAGGAFVDKRKRS